LAGDSAPPDPLAGLRVLLLRERWGGRGGVRWGGEGREGKGAGKKGRGRLSPPNVRDVLTPLSMHLF